MITCESRLFASPVLSTANFVISPATVKEDVHENAFKGRAASIQLVAGCGHLAPLVQPDDVADAVLNVIGPESTTSFTKSRL